MPRWLIERFICHRGLHTGDPGCPENSMKAFENAVREGYPIELDLQLLADGRVCVFHDLNARRMTGVDRTIPALDTAGVEKLRLMGSDQPIPMFEQVLECVNGRVPLLVEVKNSGRPGALEKTVRKVLSTYKGEYAVQSFNPRTLLWFKREEPGVSRGQLSGDFRDEDLPVHKKFVLEHLLLNPVTEPCFVGYDVRCMPSTLLARVRKRGIFILGWTVSSEEEHRRVMPYCDNIVFELFKPEKTASAR
jgi:glycerophosphoryl diester phosphodiesterase